MCIRDRRSGSAAPLSHGGTHQKPADPRHAGLRHPVLTSHKRAYGPFFTKERTRCYYDRCFVDRRPRRHGWHSARRHLPNPGSAHHSRGGHRPQRQSSLSRLSLLGLGSGGPPGGAGFLPFFRPQLHSGLLPRASASGGDLRHRAYHGACLLYTSTRESSCSRHRENRSAARE